MGGLPLRQCSIVKVGFRALARLSRKGTDFDGKTTQARVLVLGPPHRICFFLSASLENQPEGGNNSINDRPTCRLRISSLQAGLWCTSPSRPGPKLLWLVFRGAPDVSHGSK